MKKLIVFTFLLVVLCSFKSEAQSTLGGFWGYNNVDELYIVPNAPPGRYILYQDISVFITSTVYGDLNYGCSINGGTGFCYVDYDTTNAADWDTWEVYWDVIYDDYSEDSGYYRVK